MIPSPYLSSIAATFFFFFNFICLINSLSDDKYQSACQASFSSKKEVNKFWPFFFFSLPSLSLVGAQNNSCNLSLGHVLSVQMKI